MDEGTRSEKEQQNDSHTTKADISGNMRDAVIGTGGSINYQGVSVEQFVNAFTKQDEVQWKRFEQLFDRMGSEPSRIHADLLLITATDIETSAVIKQFPAYENLFLHKSAYYDFGTIAGARVCMVQSEKGSASLGGSLQTVADGINALSPTAVIMVGIAFGAGRTSQSIGDILVAQQIMAYEGQKVSQAAEGETRIIPRGDRVTASTWLLSRCHNGYADWPGAEVHFGLLLSGDKLIDNRGFRDQLLAMEPEAIGGEMEGVGLYLAAQHNKVDWIVIKAICDWADGNKGYRKNYYQQQAAENAAQFVLHIIQKGGFHR